MAQQHEAEQLIPYSSKSNSKPEPDDAKNIELKIDSASIQTKTTSIKRSITNLDKLPTNYGNIADGTYDEEMNINEKRSIKRDKQCRWMSLILTILWLLFIALLISFAVINNDEIWLYFWIPIGVLWFAYFIEWITSKTYDTLQQMAGNKSSYFGSKKSDKQSVYETIHSLEQYKPSIIWKLECYHFENNQKIVTHSEEKQYEYKHWRNYNAKFEALEDDQLTELTLYKAIKFADDETEGDYNLKQQHWFNQYENKDEFQEIFTKIEFPSFESKILIEPTVKSKYLSKDWFCLFSWFFCSSCYRYTFSAEFIKRSYCIQKEITMLDSFLKGDLIINKDISYSKLSKKVDVYQIIKENEMIKAELEERKRNEMEMKNEIDRLKQENHKLVDALIDEHKSLQLQIKNDNNDNMSQ